MLFVSWILGQVLIQYPGWNLVTISSRLIGVKLTQLFFLLFAAVIMCYFAIVIRMTGLLTKLYFFELTPLEIVGVLGVHTTMNVYVPTIELAKEAEIPGGFFDRLQSIFFAVWVLRSSAPPYSPWTSRLCSCNRSSKRSARCLGFWESRQSLICSP